MAKKMSIIFIAILVMITITIMAYFLFPWVGILSGVWFSPNPPKPDITYGEFPFEIVLEIDGQTKMFNNVYICEYDGIGSNEGIGKHRVWKGYIKGTDDSTIFIKEVGSKKIYCSVGDPEIYMGESGNDTTSNLPIVYSKEPNSVGGWTTHIFDQTEQEEYGVKIINYKFSDPIENVFKW